MSWSRKRGLLLLAEVGLYRALRIRIPEQSADEHIIVRPRVISSKDLNKPSAKLTIYDAVLEPPPSEADPDMDKFQTLLKDYLTGASPLQPSPRYRSNLFR